MKRSDCMRGLIVVIAMLNGCGGGSSEPPGTQSPDAAILAEAAAPDGDASSHPDEGQDAVADAVLDSAADSLAEAASTSGAHVDVRAYPGFIVFDCKPYLDSLPAGVAHKKKLDWVLSGGLTAKLEETGVGAVQTTGASGPIELQLHIDGVPDLDGVEVINPVLPPATQAVASDEGSLRAAVEAGGKTVRLGADVAIAQALMVKGNTFVDGQGHELRWKGAHAGSTYAIDVQGDGVAVSNLRFAVDNPVSGKGEVGFAHPHGRKGVMVGGITIEDVGTFVQCNGKPQDVFIHHSSTTSDASIRSYGVWVSGSRIVIDSCSFQNSRYEHCVRGDDWSFLAVRNCTLRNETKTLPDDLVIKTTWRTGSGEYAWGYANAHAHGQAQYHPLGGGDGDPAGAVSYVRDVASTFDFVDNTTVEIGHRASHVFFRPKSVLTTNQQCVKVWGYEHGTYEADYPHDTTHDVTIYTGNLHPPAGKASTYIDEESKDDVTLVDGP